MKKFNEYADSVAEFAQPYARRTTQFFCDTKDAIEDKYYREKKKRIRKRRADKIKNALEGTVGIVIFAVTLAVGLLAVISGVHKFLSCGGAAKIHKCKNHVDFPKNRTPKPKEKKKSDNNSGYITL